MDFLNFNILDVLDVLIVALLIFNIYRLTRGTNAISIIVGILIIYTIWIIVRLLHMELLSMLLGQIIGVGVIALIVVFQQEIRRFLLLLGSRYFSRQGRLFDLFNRSSKRQGAATPRWVEAVVSACSNMAATKTGALIVIAENVNMLSVVDSGEEIDATVSSLLLQNIFFKNSPLHDGAVVISGARIKAARCLLPTTESMLPANFGTRHRAALGVSEAYSVLAIAVSEEKGTISIAQDGVLRSDISAQQLKNALMKSLV